MEKEAQIKDLGHSATYRIKNKNIFKIGKVKLLITVQ